jgi:hypothetical protein
MHEVHSECMACLFQDLASVVEQGGLLCSAHHWQHMPCSFLMPHLYPVHLLYNKPCFPRAMSESTHFGMALPDSVSDITPLDAESSKGICLAC